MYNKGLSGVRVRFAPSPTGHMHVGNARVALINRAYAGSQGTFILRLDDTDNERSRQEYARGIIEDLQWLGIDHHILTRQSQRIDIYNKAIERLKQTKRLYPCYETAQELSLERRVQLQQTNRFIYGRQALGLSLGDIEELERQGRKPHWRFKVAQDEEVKWQDDILKEVVYKGENLSDPILIREDGRILYTLSSVIDDIEMQISHCIRGQDHISNTAIQIQIFTALCGELPIFAHLPLLKSSEEEGQVLSKRFGHNNIQHLRVQGIQSIALSSYLLSLGSGKQYMYEDMESILGSALDLHIYAGPPVFFSFDELQRLNQSYLRKMSWSEVRGLLSERAGEASSLDDIKGGEEAWLLVHNNISSISDIQRWLNILVKGEVKLGERSEEERLFMTVVMKHIPSLASGTQWRERREWQEWLSSLPRLTGQRGKQLLLPLRIALSGETRGPELEQMLSYLGHEEVRRRLVRYIEE